MQEHQEQQSKQRSTDNNDNRNNMIMNNRPTIELNSHNNDDHLSLLRATSSSASSISSSISTTSTMRAHPTMMRIETNNHRHHHHTHNQKPSSHHHSHNFPSAKITYGKPTNLGKDFIPGQYDCICGRGKYAFNHPGNKYFRNLIELARESYLKADTKIQRSYVVSGIIENVRSKGVGFVKQTKDKSGWIEVGDHLAREKVGQSLREALATKYKSSHKAKKYRRKENSFKVNQTIEDIIHTNVDISNILNEMTIKVTGRPATKGQLKHQEQQEHHHHKLPSDSELLKMFNESNKKILHYIKQDVPMVKRFQEAASILVQSGGSGDSSDNDSGNELVVMEYESIPSSWIE